jgi:hypothetical protein
VSGDLGPTSPPSPARGIAGQVVANGSLLVAILVYMGWAYEDALYGYFHVRPLDLNVGIVEYMLLSLTLFRPGAIVIAVAVIVVTAGWTWGPERTRFTRTFAGWSQDRMSSLPALRRLAPSGETEKPQAGRLLLIGVGAAIAVTGIVLADVAGLVPVSTYALLALLGGGSLLLTWPTRTDRRGRFPYSLAIVVAAVCALWASSLYAHGLGIQAAQKIVRNLSSQTSVVIYSIQRLALSGPGVTVQQLPPGFRYHYRYQGLRLLTTRSGTYYLLPVGWRPQLDLTYILDDSDQIRVELLSGVARPG